MGFGVSVGGGLGVEWGVRGGQGEYAYICYTLGNLYMGQETNVIYN